MRPNDAEVWEHREDGAVLLVFPWFCRSIVIDCGSMNKWGFRKYKREGEIFGGMPTDGSHKPDCGSLENWKRIA